MIPHNRPTLGQTEIDAAGRIIGSACLAQGAEVERFENEMCRRLGLGPGHAVAVSSGSAALYMAIRAKARRQRIETVGIPAYSCAALKNAVLLAGKKPVYLDVAKGTPNVSGERDESVDLKIVCHMFGKPSVIADPGAIEDCAQSIGARVNGAEVGTQTEIGVFSFYATKPITSGGEGGMIVSDDSETVEYLRDLREFDMKNDDIPRFNFQITDLQAAIGRVQLARLDEFIAKRRHIADRYESSGIRLWHRGRDDLDYRALIESSDPKRLKAYMEGRGIRTIIPIEEEELLCDGREAPNALELTRRLLSIPLYPSLTEEEQEHVIRALKDYMDLEGRL